MATGARDDSRDSCAVGIGFSRAANQGAEKIFAAGLGSRQAAEDVPGEDGESGGAGHGGRERAAAPGKAAPTAAFFYAYSIFHIHEVTIED